MSKFYSGSAILLTFFIIKTLKIVKNVTRIKKTLNVSTSVLPVNCCRSLAAVASKLGWAWLVSRSVQSDRYRCDDAASISRGDDPLCRRAIHWIEGRFVCLYSSLGWDDSYVPCAEGCGPAGAANVYNDRHRVNMSINLQIRHQQSFSRQFALCAKTLMTQGMNSAFSPDQSVSICRETSAQLLHGCGAATFPLVGYTSRPFRSQTSHTKRLTVIHRSVGRPDWQYSGLYFVVGVL